MLTAESADEYRKPRPSRREARLSDYRQRFANRGSRLFVVPPYVYTEASVFGEPELRFSFSPGVVADPGKALQDRFSLSGARLFDQEADGRREKSYVEFPEEFFSLASMATLAVSANWTATQVT